MRNMQKFKSGIPVGDLGQMATMLVVVGIMIGLGTLILFTVDDTAAVSPITYANESVTLANSTYTALAQPRGVAITAVTNATAGQPGLELGNFTLFANRTGTSIAMTGYPEFVSAAYWVQYTYSADSDASNSLTSGNDAIGVFGDWLEIIAIVIVAVVVLSLIKYL